MKERESRIEENSKRKNSNGYLKMSLNFGRSCPNVQRRVVRQHFFGSSNQMIIDISNQFLEFFQMNRWLFQQFIRTLLVQDFLSLLQSFLVGLNLVLDQSQSRFYPVVEELIPVRRISDVVEVGYVSVVWILWSEGSDHGDSF